MFALNKLILISFALFLIPYSAQGQLKKDELFRGMMVSPKVFRAAAKKIEPCLVTIESFGGVSTVQGRIGGIRQQGEGNTTGIMISSDGYVITSLFNFIRQPPVITVITSDGVRRVARLKGKDNTRNICILKIEDVENQPTPELVDPNDVKVGQSAISVGVGYGDKNPAISTGIVSAKNRIGGRAIQTDANISPANYGGPLVDIEGKLIGICVPLEPGATSPGGGVNWYDSGIGFAVPLHGIENIIDRLKKGETLEPGYIGVRPVFVTGTDGAKVDEVIKNTPAAKAGLRKNDVILAIDDQQVIDATNMRQILNRYNAGDKITLTVKRAPAESEEEKKDADEKDSEESDNESSSDSGSNDETNDQGDAEENKSEDDNQEAESDSPKKQPDAPDEDEPSAAESVEVIEKIEVTLTVRPSVDPTAPKR